MTGFAILFSAVVIVTCLASNAVAHRWLKKTLKRFPAPGAKRIPNVANLGTVMPPLIVTDHRGIEHRLGTQTKDFFVLMTSLGCPVCSSLHTALSHHAKTLQSRGPLFLLSRSDHQTLLSKLSPAEYPILNHVELFTFLGDKTLPVLFSVRDLKLVGGYIVNTIDHMFSVICPDLLGDEGSA